MGNGWKPDIGERNTKRIHVSSSSWAMSSNISAIGAPVIILSFPFLSFQKINSLLPWIYEIVTDGLIEVQDMEVIKCASR